MCAIPVGQVLREEGGGSDGITLEEERKSWPRFVRQKGRVEKVKEERKSNKSHG